MDIEAAFYSDTLMYELGKIFMIRTKLPQL